MTTPADGRMFDRATRRDLLVIAVLTLLKGFVWAASYPLWKIADEPSHFDHIQYRAEWGTAPQYRGGKIEPVMGRGMSDELKKSWTASQKYFRDKYLADTKEVPEEAELATLAESKGARLTDGQMTALHYPAFFYTVAQAPYRLFRTSSIVIRAYAIRFSSMALYGVLAALATFLAARTILRDRMLAIAATAIVVLNPVASQMTSAVNNDAAIIGLAAFVFLCQVQIICAERIDLRWAAALGFGVGLALITKPQAAALGPGAALCFAPHLLRRASFRRGLVAAAIALAAACIVFLPTLKATLELNAQLKEMGKGMGGTLKPLIEPGYLAFLDSRTEHTFTVYFWQTWCQLGWMEFSVPGGWHNRLLAPSLLVKIGLAASAVLYVIREGRDRLWFVARGVVFSAFCALVGVLFMLYVEYNFQLNIGVANVIQGRGFLFALPPFAIVVVAGLGSLTPQRLRGITAAAIVTAMVSLQLAGIVAVMGNFYGG